jgi:hypothetical protein
MKKIKEMIKFIFHLIISAILVLCAIWAVDNGFKNALIAFIVTSIYWIKLENWKRSNCKFFKQP